MGVGRALLMNTTLVAGFLGLATIIPAYEDELYYWCWSKELQWSYYDHPPIIALLIRLSTSVFGDSLIGIRFPACLSATFVVYVIHRLTPLTPLAWGAVASPIYTFFAVLMLPDSPLMLFWAAYVWWLIEIQHRLEALEVEAHGLPQRAVVEAVGDSPGVIQPRANADSVSFADSHRETLRTISVRWWIAGGIILGCGLLSKYTMGLAVPAGLISLIFSGQHWRRWFADYLTHGIVAYLVSLPILVYNVDLDFEPILFQWRHISEPVSSSIESIGYFVGIQVLLFGLLPFLLLPWAILQSRRLFRDPCLRVCWCFYVLPLLFFLYQSTQHVVLENWPIVSFVSFWPLAAEWCRSAQQRTRGIRTRVAAVSFLPSALSCVLLGIHLVWPLTLLPGNFDRVSLIISTNAAMHQIAEVIRERHEPLPVYAGRYQDTAQLRFESLDARQIDGLSPRTSQFTVTPQHLTDVDRAYVVLEDRLPEWLCPGFDKPELLARVPVHARGTVFKIFQLWLYSKTKLITDSQRAD
jgi:4-amino-4-deoxy-L-arabinose transferase-like glycosyltransferase